uniref:Uncharacterized protein n=1 Tax=viral metagenome TaxID=1070528 RepID=A0A6M3X5Q7_9ZZZZ
MSIETLPSDAELGEAAEAFLDARAEERRVRHALVQLMRKRDERTLIHGNTVIIGEGQMSNALKVERHLRTDGYRRGAAAEQ